MQAPHAGGRGAASSAGKAAPSLSKAPAVLGKGPPPAKALAPAGKGSPPKAPAPGGKGPAPLPGKASLGKGSAPGKGAPPGKAPLPPKSGPGLGPGRTPSHGGVRGPQPDEGAEGPKLRPLFWALTRSVEADSVWANVGKPVHFDRSQLERRFLLAAPRATPGAPGTPKATARGARDGDASVDVRKRVRVLDDRTSQNLEIAFRKLPPPKDLARQVDSLEDFPEGLSSEAVLALHNASIEQQEAIDQIRQLALSEADVQQLDIPERYLWVLGHLPSCAAKLACGALLVGPAGEIGDLRQSGERVISCCKAMRNSDMLKRCLSTSLAVGNLLNRGTSRAGAQGVVLPDALLKLDELRGAPLEGQEAAPGSEGKGPSVLDFVAQALVDDRTKGAGAAALDGLKAEAEQLLSAVRKAQAVPLEEAEASCRKVFTQAQRAEQGLGQVGERSAGVACMAERVHKVCEEANVALNLLIQAREEQARTLLWSSTKDPKVKSSDWFALWGQFLDQLQRAISRARLPSPPSRVPPIQTGLASPKHPPVSTPSKPGIKAPSSTSAACGGAGEEECALSSTLSGLTPLCRQVESAAQVSVPQDRRRTTLVRRMGTANSQDRADEGNQSDVTDFDEEPVRRRTAAETHSARQSSASSDDCLPNGTPPQSPARKTLFYLFSSQTPVTSPPARHVRQPHGSSQVPKLSADARPIDSVTKRRRAMRRQTGSGGG